MHLSDYSAESIAALLATVMRDLELADPDVLAVGASCVIAVALERIRGVTINNLLLIDPWLFDEDERKQLIKTYVPDLVPGEYGQHLFTAWAYARDSELFWPWNVCNTENALHKNPEILPEQTHARAVDALKAGSAFSRLVHALLAYDLADALAAVETPVLSCARQGNGHETRAEEAARICPNATYNRLPAAISDWSGELIELLNSRD